MGQIGSEGAPVFKAVVMGPESTGKSELAQWLAASLRCPAVPEYARPYLEQSGGVCRRDDIPRIAAGQAALELRARQESRGILISDTDLFTTVLWSEFYFGECPGWVREEAVRLKGVLYLLMDIDLPWVPDGLRDGPHTRPLLLRRFQEQARAERLPFVWVRGTGRMRQESALRAIEGELGRWRRIK